MPNDCHDPARDDGGDQSDGGRIGEGNASANDCDADVDGNESGNENGYCHVGFGGVGARSFPLPPAGVMASRDLEKVPFSLKGRSSLLFEWKILEVECLEESEVRNRGSLSYRRRQVNSLAPGLCF